MYKIERDMVAAIRATKNFSRNRNVVRWHGLNKSMCTITLKGKRIALYIPNKALYVQRHEGAKRVTMSRLNALATLVDAGYTFSLTAGKPCTRKGNIVQRIGMGWYRVDAYHVVGVNLADILGMMLAAGVYETLDKYSIKRHNAADVVAYDGENMLSVTAEAIYFKLLPDGEHSNLINKVLFKLPFMTYVDGAELSLAGHKQPLVRDTWYRIGKWDSSVTTERGFL